MGMITSDFYSRFDKIDIVESPFTVEELMNLASVDTQAQFAAWTAENGDTSYIPAEIFLTLMEDRAFFEQICSFVDGGEYVVLSGATLACRTSHSSRMGLTREDVQQNIQEFFAKDEEMTYSIESVLSGTREWVSSLYVFANGWVGIETERFADSGWDEEEDSAQDSTPEPASSYLLDAEGELVASPDIRYDIEAWMDFVDMFSTVHEEAVAPDTPDKAEGREVELRSGREGYIVFSEEVESAIKEGRPVVVIESAATFGGMIYPGIAEFAYRMRNTVRENGAVPAFAAILNGQIHVGLTDDEILYLEQKRGSIFKASARDIPILLAKKQDGVMTIAAAVKTAQMVGLPVASGSGIGGAQIGAGSWWYVPEPSPFWTSRSPWNTSRRQAFPSSDTAQTGCPNIWCAAAVSASPIAWIPRKSWRRSCTSRRSWIYRAAYWWSILCPRNMNSIRCSPKKRWTRRWRMSGRTRSWARPSQAT